MIGGFRSGLSIACMLARNFGVFYFPRSCINENGGKRSNHHCERFGELAIQSFHVGSWTFINSFDKTKFSFYKFIAYKYRQEILAIISNFACKIFVDAEYMKLSYI